MVQVHLGPPVSEVGGQKTEDRTASAEGATLNCPLSSGICPLNGGVAQLGERLPCTQEAIGSIPFTSTIQDTGARKQETDGLAAYSGEKQ